MRKKIKQSGIQQLFLILVLILTCTLVMMTFSACSSSSDSDSDTTSDVSGDGKGGDDDLDNSLLKGTHYTGIFASTENTMWNQTANMVFDGSGDYNYNIIYDSTDESGNYSGEYTVAENGEFSLLETDAKGIVASDGQTTVFSDSEPAGLDDAIYLAMSIEKSTGISTSDLSGNFVVCEIRNDGSQLKASRYLFSFDGNGTYTANYLSDSDGSSGDISGMYSMAEDGELSISVNGLTKTFQGYLSSGGDKILIMDDDDDNEVMMMVGLKKPSRADITSFSGNFQLNQLGGDGDSQWVSSVNATADGSGSLTVEIINDSSGESGTYTVDYTISDDGSFQLVDVGEGVISADGNTVLIVGTDATEGIIMMIGIKKH